MAPFDKKEVREAVNTRHRLEGAGAAFGRRLQPGCNFLPQGVPGYEKIDPARRRPERPGRPAKAKQIIQDAGADGEAVTV